MAIDAVGLRSGVNTSSDHKWSEDGIRCLEVIVHDIDEEEGIHHLCDQLTRLGIGFIDMCPLLTEFKRFILFKNLCEYSIGRLRERRERGEREERETNLPSHETDCFDDGGLDNLFAWEDTPCHGVGTITVRVGPEVACLVDRVISDIGVPLDVQKEFLKQCWGYKELEIGL